MTCPASGTEVPFFRRLLQEFWPDDKQVSVEQSTDGYRYFGQEAVYPFDQAIRLFEETLISNRDMRLSTKVFLPSQRESPLELRVHGDKFRNGLERDTLGTILVEFDYEHLHEPFLDFGLFRNANKEELNEAILNGPRELILCIDSIRLDLEDIFFRTCGLTGTFPLESMPLTAATSFEATWPTPGKSALIYHRKYRDFCKDLGRMYMSYHWGNSISSTLVPLVSFKDLQAAPRKDWETSLKDWLSYSRSIESSEGVSPTFMHLELSRILNLYEGIPEHLAKVMFDDADNFVGELRELIQNPGSGILAYDFEERGCVWSSGVFFSGTWPRYRDLLDRAISIISPGDY